MQRFVIKFHISGGRTIQGLFEFEDETEAAEKTENLLRGKGKFLIPGKEDFKTYLVEKSFVVYAEILKLAEPTKEQEVKTE